MESGNRKMVTLFFHFSVFSMYMYTLIYDSVYLLEAPHRTSYAGRFKFLTFWNEVRINLVPSNTQDVVCAVNTV